MISKVINIRDKELAFAHYILESSLLSTETLNFNQLEVVSGSLYIVAKIFEGKWIQKVE